MQREEILREAADLQERLLKIALHWLRDYEKAQDAVQDVIVKAASRSDQFREKSSVYTWLVRILLNHCHDLHRKEKRRSAILAFVPVEVIRESRDLRDTPDRKTEQSDLHKRLFEAMGRLQPMFRDIIILRYFDGLSYGDIAEVSGIQEGTVKSRLNTARDLLRKELAKAGVTEDWFG